MHSYSQWGDMCQRPRRETEASRMTQPNPPYFAYAYDAWSYVERVQKQLELFDAGNPESLF